MGGAPLVRMSDGHHRGAALYRAGVREVLVWVNVLEVVTPRGPAVGGADPEEEEQGA